MGKNISGPNRLTPTVRVAYTNTLFEPKAVVVGGDPKYGVRIMFDKTNPADLAFLKQLNQDAEAVKAEHWPDPTKRPRIPFYGSTYQNVIKDGDTAVNKNGFLYSEKDPELKGHFFMGIASQNKPGVIDLNHTPILDKSVVYGGCYCDIGLNVYSYEGKPDDGVTVGLNAVRKQKDGDRLGGGAPSIEEIFGKPPGGGSSDPTNYQSDPFAAASAGPGLDDDVPF